MGSDRGRKPRSKLYWVLSVTGSGMDGNAMHSKELPRQIPAQIAGLTRLIAHTRMNAEFEMS